MTTKHWVLAALACVLAFGSASASDTTKSKIDPKKLMDFIDEEQVSITSLRYTSAPNPNDTAYIDELYQQLALQQAQVQAAQAALAAATDQLALAQQVLALQQQAFDIQWTTITTAWNNQALAAQGSPAAQTQALAAAKAQLAFAQQVLALQQQAFDIQWTTITTAWKNQGAATQNFAISQGSAGLLEQAQTAWNNVAEALGSNPNLTSAPIAFAPLTSNAEQTVALLTQAVNALQGPMTVAQAQTAWNNVAEALRSNGNLTIAPIAFVPLTSSSNAEQTVALLTQAVNADAVTLQRAQAAVAATDALINAAQNGQSPPSNQTSDAGNSDPNAQASDAQDMAILSIQGGSDYDAGDADGGGSD